MASRSRSCGASRASQATASRAMTNQRSSGRKRTAGQILYRYRPLSSRTSGNRLQATGRRCRGRRHPSGPQDLHPLSSRQAVSGASRKNPGPDGHAAARAAASWGKGSRSPGDRSNNGSPGSNRCSGSPDRNAHPVAGENADAIAASNTKSFFAWRSSGRFGCAGQKCRLSRCGTSVKHHSIILKIKNKKYGFPQNRKRLAKKACQRNADGVHKLLCRSGGIGRHARFRV